MLAAALASCSGGQPPEVPAQAAPAAIDVEPESTREELRRQLCADVGIMAGTIMGARQAGVPLAKALEIASSTSAEQRAVVTEIVEEAYDQSRYDSEEIRERVTHDFIDRQHLNCLRDPRILP